MGGDSRSPRDREGSPESNVTYFPTGGETGTEELVERDEVSAAAVTEMLTRGRWSHPEIADAGTSSMNVLRPVAGVSPFS